MKFKTKLYVGFGSKLLIIIFLIALVLNLSQQIKQNMDEITQERYMKVRLATTIRFEISNMDRGLMNLVYGTVNGNFENQLDLIHKAQTSTVQNLSQLERVATDDKVQQNIDQLQILLSNYDDIEQKVVALVKDGKHQEASQLMLNEALQLRLQMFNGITELTAIQEQLMDKSFDQANQTYLFQKKVLWFALIASLLLGIAITISIIRSIGNSLNRVVKVITSVSPESADKLPRIEVLSDDEIGEISIAFNRMAQILEEYHAQEKEIKQQIQKKAWLETNISEIATAGQGVQDLHFLSALVLTKLAPILGASYGVFYIQEEQQIFRKYASYAVEGQEIGRESFTAGEGLIGQSALENRRILISDVPEDYIAISSGLGSISPKNICIHPIGFEGHVIAVFEFASLNEFNGQQFSLLEHISDHLGITINSIKGFIKIEQLLRESQALTEELQTQSEELQLQQEELKSINEKLEEQYKESEQKTRELEQVKDELEQKANHVELASKYKSEFLANMSHELRTPLNSLLIFAQMLAENQERNLTAKQVEFANTIYSSGSDLLQLINDILDLAKVESGKMIIHTEAVRLHHVMSFVERNFLPIARNKAIEFTMEIAPDIPEIIYTDELRLKQILKNLLSNAFKFTEKGSVQLRIDKADRSKWASSQMWENVDEILVYSVSDTGIGIPSDKLALIFEAFQQADGTTSRNYGGTGLGLSISREIAYLLGGSLEVKSEEGKGSLFQLFLPVQTQKMEQELYVREEVAAGLLHRAKEPEKVESLPASPIVGGKEILKGKKILIVDDDMRNVFALTTVLEKKQIQVLFAEQGLEGIRILRENPDIDLVLMDIMMPEMDGYETMRTIRQMSEFENLPIIALTAKAMKSDREKCIEAGASDYISKPVDLEQLFSLLHVWLY